jgi:hypothetical protein
MTERQPRRIVSDLHVYLDQNTLSALDALRETYRRRGVLTSRSSMARLAIQMAASSLTASS